MEMLTTLQKSILQHSWNILAAALIFAAFWVASLLVSLAIRKMDQGADPGRKDIFLFVGQVVKAVLIVIGSVTALGTVGVNVSALVAGLGLTGFALGFALRDVLSNLLAGVLILVYRPFRRGDRIAAANFEGVVKDIDLRYTTLQGEGRRILVPNSMLFTHALVVLEKASEKTI